MAEHRERSRSPPGVDADEVRRLAREHAFLDQAPDA